MTVSEILKRIIDSFKPHPSLELIEKNLSQEGLFNFAKASARDVNNIIRNINPNKATGSEKIVPKLVKLSVNVIDAHLTYVFNHDKSLDVFFNSVKIASDKAVYIDQISSDFMTAYRKGYSTSNVLIRLIENWRKPLIASLSCSYESFKDV